MVKLIKHVFLFVMFITITLLFYSKLADKASHKYYGINTAEQIERSFNCALSKKYNCYFLGNSRIYRDINPEKFDKVVSYNFAHDHDSYNQMYYKLLYLLNGEAKIDYLIIGTDYFQFSVFSDSRNYIYYKFFPNEYIKDYGDYSWFELKKNFFFTKWDNARKCLPACIKYVLHVPNPKQINYLKDNGQYICYGNATGRETIKRDYNILDVQYDYFKKIINTCRKNGIVLFIIMPPLWEGETRFHSETERIVFNDMIRNALHNTPYERNYINYTEEKGLSSYIDFIDVTHLSPAAADVFSTYINKRIFDL